jgi:hypothetical protein
MVLPAATGIHRTRYDYERQDLAISKAGFSDLANNLNLFHAHHDGQAVEVQR